MRPRLQLKAPQKYKCQSRKFSTDSFAKQQRKYERRVKNRDRKNEIKKLREAAKEKVRLEKIGRFDRDARFKHHQTEWGESVIRNGQAVRRGCIKLLEGRYCEFCVSSKMHLLQHSMASRAAVKTLLRQQRRNTNTLNKRPCVAKMDVITKQIKSKHIESAEEHLQCLKQQ